jgi:hypothetical protein
VVALNLNIIKGFTAIVFCVTSWCFNQKYNVVRRKMNLKLKNDFFFVFD